MIRPRIALVALLALGLSVVPAAANAGKPEKLSVTDMFVLGTNQAYTPNGASLTRVKQDGQVVWSTMLADTTGEVIFNYRAADRNVAEDAFYVFMSSNGGNLLDGKGQLRRYSATGRLSWAVGLDTSAGLGETVVSANPVKGGAYVSTPAGVYRINRGDGSIMWGPLTFGLTADGWGVATNNRDGGAFVTNYSAGKVMRITAVGTVVWTVDIAQPSMALYSPTDDGLYLGSGSYSSTTVKLGADGSTEWTLTGFPSWYTYGRAVSPVDGSLWVTSGWDARIGHVAPDGTVLNDVYLNGGWGGVANQGLAASLSGTTLFTGNSADQLGVAAYTFPTYSTMTRQWLVDPGYFAQTGDGYAPYYRPYVGMPRVK